MLIEIKKIKATKSIMDQIQQINQSDISTLTINKENVLGWFIMKSGKAVLKYILLKTSEGIYRKLRFPIEPEKYEKHEKEVEEIKWARELFYFCKLSYGRNYIENRTCFQTNKSQRDHFYNQIQAIRRIAQQQGQFFI